MSIRVLYVSATGMLGGAEYSLLELVRALDRQRVEPLAAVPADQPLAERLRELGVDVAAVPRLRPRRTTRLGELASMARRWADSVRTVVREARRRRVDLIHSNTTAAHLVGSSAGALAHLPAVWHVRDFRAPALLGPLMLQPTRGVIFVSQVVRLANRLTDRPGLMARVIPNGIDADGFASAARPGAFRAELGVGAKVPLLLMAAQMVPWKGHVLLIRAVKLLKDTWPELVAVIAGADLFGEHGGYEASLRRLVSQLGLTDSVRLVGYRTDMPTLIADCDVVVIPSEAEPFGRVALEAMALGRPTVGMAAGGLREVVADGETGLLVPERSVAALAEAMGRILSDPSLGAAMGAKALERVRSEFSAAAHARTVTRFYEDILA